QRAWGGAEVVLKYLARYVGRVALGNERLGATDGSTVTFVWKDYARGGVLRQQRLGVEEFLGRFLEHVLPRGLVKVRHSGLLANHGREERLGLCRWLLVVAGLGWSAGAAVAAAAGGWPVCGVGGLVLVGVLPREVVAGEVSCDSS